MYQSLQDILNLETQSGKSFWEIVRDRDCKELEITAKEAFGKMEQMYLAMEAADRDYDPTLRSSSGLAGQDGEKIARARVQGSLLCGPLLGLVMEKAVKMGESNACMRRIVAAPTAGSCGVVPAVLLSLEQEKGYAREEMIKALYVCAGIGVKTSPSAVLDLDNGTKMLVNTATIITKTRIIAITLFFLNPQFIGFILLITLLPSFFKPFIYKYYCCYYYCQKCYCSKNN